MKVLVVGARPGSIGAHVVEQAAVVGYDVRTAGIVNEEYQMDVTNAHAVHDWFMRGGDWKPDHVVCTVGVNLPGTIKGKRWLEALETQMRINFQGPMHLLSAWSRYWRSVKDRDAEEFGRVDVRHFAALSSNSAHVARSASGSYCASKAALSMGLRCAAREAADWPFAIYGYEPGWIQDTPMSKTVDIRLEGLPRHRIPGGNEVSPSGLAGMIVDNLGYGRWLNGTLIRVDGGEQ